MMKPLLYTSLCLLGLFCSTVLGGECLKDSNYGQPASAYNTRLYSYSPSSAHAASSSDLTIMSYNLQSSISSSCVSNPTAQAQQMSGADYVGTQETAQGIDTRCNCNMPQIIANTNGIHTRFVMTIPFRSGQYGIGLGTSQTILDTKYALLQYSGVEQRALVAVKTQPPALKGKNLWFISTHVEFYVWAARQSQVTQIKDWVQSNILNSDSEAVVIVVGDFNSGPGDQAYTTMSSLFKNTWEVYHGSSGDGYSYPANSPSNRFDHIWYRVPSSVTVRITNFQIVNTQDSDHRPIRATFSFTTSGSGGAASPTTKPSSPTAAPTSKPVTSPTSAPAPSSGSCTATATFNKANNQIVITNTGTKAIKSIVLGFSPSLPSNNWNLDAKGSNQYSLPSFAYGSLATHGGTYTSSGFYTTGTVPTITVASVTC